MSLRRGNPETKRSSDSFAETMHSIYTCTRCQARFIVDPKIPVRSGRREFRPKIWGVALNSASYGRGGGKSAM